MYSVANHNMKILLISPQKLLGKSCRDSWVVCRSLTPKSSPNTLTCGRRVTEGKYSWFALLLKEKMELTILKTLWISCKLHTHVKGEMQLANFLVLQPFPRAKWKDRVRWAGWHCSRLPISGYHQRYYRWIDSGTYSINSDISINLLMSFTRLLTTLSSRSRIPMVSKL